jgi:transposase
MYSGVSLRFLKSFPTSYSILQTDKETLHAKIKELLSSRRDRSDEWINERVKRLLEAAKQNPFEQTMYASHLINLTFSSSSFFSTRSILLSWNRT